MSNDSVEWIGEENGIRRSRCHASCTLDVYDKNSSPSPPPCLAHTPSAVHPPLVSARKCRGKKKRRQKKEEGKKEKKEGNVIKSGSVK